ncbi:PREDICTED: myogenic factor 5-like isoform X1 [Branchiostoma belcheri]|uniref:Myogenic factor 5-like isoform X1 n=1 Tax=Branchiostoma belcheri TaxID=7741 RepID=A0A6P4Y2L5_BRABE|nr:PREDICTED: myogenic factor 5-like isoform X1 [Branchiostoma belcheri]
MSHSGRRGRKAGELSLTGRKTHVGRSVATEREKRRLAKMNEAFQDLRSTLPEKYRGCDTKLDLLRGAVEYIRYLQKCLADNYEGTSAEQSLKAMTPLSLLSVHSSFIADGRAVGPQEHV